MKIAGQLVHFINPSEVVSRLEINPGDVIADFGCGSGYFTLPAAEVTGKEGVVYAFDILPQALETVLSKAKIAGLANISVIRANLEKKKGTGLTDESVDYVIMKDVLFQNKDKESILAEAARILKPEGQALVIEWNNKDFSLGPDKSLRISREKLIKMIKNQKFRIKKIINAGHFHYGFVITKDKK